MKHRIRFAAWSLAFCLSLTVLFSCSDKTEPADTTDTEAISTAPITEVQTAETEVTAPITEFITET
ncbi:MAG: hypothetical protein IKZ09_04850, partial [Clostridia bacterium]|nr:hypothetical protein [Clostridia bacterium]